MNKLFKTCVLCILLCCTLGSCAENTPTNNPEHSLSSSDENTDPGVTTTTTTTKKPSQTDPEQNIIPIIGGVRAETESYQVKQNGAVALEVSLSLPVAEIDGDKEIEKKLSERLDAIKDDLDIYIKGLESQYKTMISLGSKPLFTPRISVSFELSYFTKKAMSLTFNITEVNGFGVTTRSSRHYNYEFDFASSITFSAVFSDREGLINAVIAKAEKKEDLFKNYEELIPSLIDGCWYVTDRHVVFSFDPYQIAPASSGFITFEFERSEIADYVSDYGKDLFGF